ncbi:MAG TPA: hypothetical protein VGG69_06380 [Rhizomicrobium sp.]|jgi:hypothetical protein
MKAIALAAALLTAGMSAATAQPATPMPHGNVCLKTYWIDHTKSPDDRTIVFYMKDGSAYQSSLPTLCPQLSVNGFAYVATPPSDVCGNMQTIRVIRTGSVCMLGPLVQITPKRAETH